MEFFVDIDNYIDPKQLIKTDIITVRALISYIREERLLPPNDPGLEALSRIISFVSSAALPENNTPYMLRKHIDDIQSTLRLNAGKINHSAATEDILNGIVAYLYRDLEYRDAENFSSSIST